MPDGRGAWYVVMHNIGPEEEVFWATRVLRRDVVAHPLPAGRARVAPQAIGDPRVELAHLRAHTFSGIARSPTSLRDSRATLRGAGAGATSKASSNLATTVALIWVHKPRETANSCGFSTERGGGIRTLAGRNRPERFSRLILFRSTMPSQAWCATQRATVRFE
jgi:hypothetical protein